MGISYDPTKPAANDRPSNDQPVMQTNFASIGTLIDVDHVDFANANYGMHKWVQFPSIFTPGATVPVPRIFTNSVDGSGNALPGSLAQFLMYNGGTAAQSSLQNNVTSTNGSVMLPMGIILKWGSYTLAPGVPNTTITFTNAFPNAVFSLVFGSNVSGSAGDLPNFASLTKTGFTGGRASSSPLGGTYTYNWLAIGN